MTDSLVTVIIPAYQAAATIAETLESVARQTYPNIEVIIVDDGSTDRTTAIVEDFVRRDSRMKLIRQENGGVAAARNTGLAAARGELIAPLDADDLWHPEKIARQVSRMLSSSPDVGVVYSWSVDIDDQSVITEQRLDVDRFEGDVYAALVLGNFVGNASAPLIRRSILAAVNGWDPSLRARQAQGCEDLLTYLRLAERCDYALEPAFLIGYRQTGGAMSRQYRAMARSFALVIKEARLRHPTLPSYLFRWARSIFCFYLFNMSYASSPLLGMRYLGESVILDPASVIRRSTYRKFRQFVSRRILRRAPPPAPKRSFSELDPSLAMVLDEGPVHQNRKGRVAAMRVRGPLTQAS